MSKPTGVTYIKRLKEMTSDRIRRKYSEVISAEDKASSDIQYELNKNLMKEIEEDILNRYPVKKIPKCEYHHSSCSTERIELGFYPEFDEMHPTVVQMRQHEAKMKELRAELNSKLAALDDWEFNAVNAAARKQELPEFVE